MCLHIGYRLALEVKRDDPLSALHLEVKRVSADKVAGLRAVRLHCSADLREPRGHRIAGFPLSGLALVSTLSSHQEAAFHSTMTHPTCSAMSRTASMPSSVRHFAIRSPWTISRTPACISNFAQVAQGGPVM